jgi:putative pyruvate formate lyase activating enzyme
MEIQVQPDFFLSSRDFEPAYLRLYRTGELKKRAQKAIESLSACCGCPRKCRDDRLADKAGVCKTGRFACVSSFSTHQGEERCLSGWHGSGTIFFTWCNLRCPFCQNYEISYGGHGAVAPPERLAEMMLELQQAGCHNINLVTPSHVVPQILEALVCAAEGGLRLPIIYNTSAYDSVESLRRMDGVVDIYMPDFKIWDPGMSIKYLAARDYPEVARRAIKEMHHQVGELKVDEQGLARRGVLVRHLVMPGGGAGTREIMKFLAREISPHTYVNVMAQYFSAGKVSSEYLPEINRRITGQEYSDAMALARQMGLYRFAEN